jgi:enterochelin esterase family protein
MRSALIEAFVAAVREDASAATEVLRRQLAAARGPLVEPIDGDEGHVLVTFVWIGADGPVSVETQLVASELAATSHPLTRVEGADVWVRSTVVRADVRSIYQFVLDDPFMRPGDEVDPLAEMEATAALYLEMCARSYADPHNPCRLPPTLPAGSTTPPEENWDSVLSLRDAEAVAWFDPPQLAPTVIERKLASAALGNERTLIVVPPCEQPQAVVVLLDGEWWFGVAALQAAVENLVSAGRIPPTLVAFIHNATAVSRQVELACNPGLPAMLADELLPMLREEYGAPDDPAAIVVGGASLGGLAAAHAAFVRPDAFGNVLSCSGSYWWGDEPEWLTWQYAEAERKPLRFWVDVGVLERERLPYGDGLDMVSVNRRFEQVLRTKGYDVTYRETPGGHEFATWRGSAASGLQTLLAQHG